MSYPDALEADRSLALGSGHIMYSLHWKPHGLTILGRGSYFDPTLSVRSAEAHRRGICVRTISTSTQDQEQR